jgi:hypothetical protein
MQKGKKCPVCVNLFKTLNTCGAFWIFQTWTNLNHLSKALSLNDKKPNLKHELLPTSDFSQLTCYSYFLRKQTQQRYKVGFGGV